MARVGVFVCHCGENIARSVQVQRVVPAGHPFVNGTRLALARVLRWSGRDDEARLVEARDVGANTPRRP